MSRKASWRSGEQEAAKQARRSWQGSREVKAVVKKRPNRWKRLARAGLGLLACCAALVFVVIQISPPRPARLILLGAAGAANLAIPANAYGAHTLKDLEELSRVEVGLLPFWRSRPLRQAHETVALAGPAWSDVWKQEVKRWKEEAIPERTVVVFLSLHGGSNGQSAYFLPDAAPDRAENRLPLEDVIDAMASLPAANNKVLIVDATQIADDWSLGMLQNDFARHLEALRPKIEAVENLWVLSASGPDQRSWIDEERKRSVFGRYVIEGLRGAADSEGKDHRITLAELYNYVRREVESWVWDHRGAVQEPVLLPASDAAVARAAQVPVTFAEAGPGPGAGALSEGTVETGAGASGETAKVNQAWAEYGDLVKQPLSPRTYAPLAWRQFKEHLLRIDLLSRAGDSAGDLWDEIGRLRKEIDEAKTRVELKDARHANLAMATVLESQRDLSVQERANFDKLYAAQAAQLDDVWKATVGVTGDGSERGKYHAYLYDRVIQPGQPLDLARAAEQFGALPIRPRMPAEVHFLRMLKNHLPSGSGERVPEETIRRALVVRRLAEQTALGAAPGEYAHSEEVFPWIKDLVEKADEARRWGEDLLFADERSAWDEAAEALEEARRLYRDAGQRADEVRAAIEVRDRALDELPGYTRSWGRRFSVARNESDGDREFTGRIEALWGQVHEVADLLARPDGAKSPGDPAREIAEGLKAVEERFARDCRDVERRQVAEDWVSGVALEVAFTRSDAQPGREELPGPRRVVRSGRGEGAGVAGGDVARVESDSEKVEHERRMRERAQLQGRLALAVMGKRWFDEARAAGTDSYQATLANLSASSGRPEGWRDVAEAGERVADLMHRRAEAVQEHFENGVARTRQEEITDRESHFRQADLLSRQVDGTTSLRALPSSSASGAMAKAGSPSEALRRVRLHDLLLWLAERTLRDHWFGESARSDDVYYRDVGRQLVADARTFVEESSEAKEREEQLDQPGELTFGGPEHLDWTSERAIDLSFDLKPVEGANVPLGTAIVRGAARDRNLLEIAAEGAPRSTHETGKPSSAGPEANALRYRLESPFVASAEEKQLEHFPVKSTTFDVTGFYRGQSFARTVDVKVHASPTSTLMSHPKPGSGRIAVRASRELFDLYAGGDSAVAIVLDCSSSMENIYKDAVGALEEMLRKLPRGTSVSLWVFGARKGNPEDCIFQIQRPVSWDPARTADLVGRMRRLVPENFTPLMRTMIQARADLDAVPDRSFKTLVVLTDGDDKRFVNDTQFNPEGKDVAWALERYFANSGVTINFVCFGNLPPAVAAAARDQYKAIENLQPRGQFFPARDRQKLANVLLGIIPRRFDWTMREVAGGPGVGSVASPVTMTGTPEQWSEPLEAGHYDVVLDAIGHTQRVALKGGDCLLLELRDTAKGGVELARPLLVDEPVHQHRERAEAPGWRVGVLQNRLEDDGLLRMMVSLEKVDNRVGVLVEQIEPEAVWLEVEAVGAARPITTRWIDRDNYAGNVWMVEVPDWPIVEGKAAVANVRVYWNDGDESARAIVLDREQENLGDVTRIRDLLVGGNGPDDQVVIENVDFERRPLPSGLGEAPEEVYCVVVRVRHPVGKPYLARLDGVESESSQHRHYAEAGKSAAFFWPLRKEEIASLRSLSLVDVEAFRQRAKALGFFVSFPELQPRRNDPELKPCAAD